MYYVAKVAILAKSLFRFLPQRGEIRERRQTFKMQLSEEQKQDSKDAKKDKILFQFTIIKVDQ